MTHSENVNYNIFRLSKINCILIVMQYFILTAEALFMPQPQNVVINIQMDLYLSQMLQY